MNSESLNRRSVWIAGLGTGLLVYGIFSDNLRFSRVFTLVLGGGLLLIGGITFLITRERKG